MAASLALAAPAEAAPRFERCGVFGFQCARVSVPLDRSGALPGRVSLFVKRIHARESPRRGALVVLAGGPGQSATDAFGGSALSVLHPAYRNRDLIIFDQRGTGRSGLLRCRALERANLLEGGVAAGRCAARIGRRRALYTSRESVEDIESIRVALGYERIALFGISYGTKVALGYAAMHPGNVERLVLDSVVEADGPNPLYLDTMEAVPRALRTLCRAGCSAFTPDPVADVAALVRRLARAPLRGRVVLANGAVRRSRLEREDLFVVLLAGDLNPAVRAGFPGAVRAALDGDAAPLLRLRDRAYAVDGAPPPSAGAQRDALHGGDLRGDAVPVGAHGAARPGGEAGSRCRRGGSAPRQRLLPVRPRHRREQRPRRPLRPLARGARGARLRRRARCRTCPCSCSRGRTTCGRRSRTRAAWRPDSRGRASWWRPRPATRRSAAT